MWKGAFLCRSCPKSNHPERGCPVWWETIWTGPQGQTETIKACGFVQLPHYLNDMARQTAGAAASAQEARDTVSQGMRAVALTLFGVRNEASSNLPNPAIASGNGVRAELAGSLTADIGGVQQPGSGLNSHAADATVDGGPDLFRYLVGEAHLVERDGVG